MWLKVILSALMLADVIWKIRSKADMGLPLIQISHDDYDADYAEIKEEVHLEDFFWTGSGDGPPEYLKKVHTGISKGKDVIVKTETVVATVYVDGNNEIDIPICLDCPPNEAGAKMPGWDGNNAAAPPFNYSATDRRFWLLTVMSGFFTQKDNPMLEEKLARLYRLAFTRQQSRHLGINGAQHIWDSYNTNRDRRQPAASTETTSKERTAADEEIFDMTTKSFDNTPSFKEARIHPINPNSELETSSEEVEIFITNTEATTMVTDSDDAAYVTIFPWEFIQQNGMNDKLKSIGFLKTNLATEFKPQFPSFRESHVRVVIHNLTQITEQDMEKGILYRDQDDDINTKIDNRPIANQTELIYSVFVDNRPVLATTAANDMRLISDTEVVNVIGKEIFMKAEPYLKEPQATPLAPATRSGSDTVLDSIQKNPALVSVSSVAILLLLLLLIALFLMGRGRLRAQNNDTTRSVSHNELLSEGRSERPTCSAASVIDSDRTNAPSRDVGIQNFSFENESTQTVREPRIYFPAPPEHRSRRSSITSSDNTSDSSVYCPINPPTSDVQKFLDEKAATLFDGHKQRHHQYDHVASREDAVYTSVVSEKKNDKNRHKKRRYLTENRVGSVETSPAQSVCNAEDGGIVMESMDEDGNVRIKHSSYERTETYNTHNNYHRNKILHQKSGFIDKESKRKYDEKKMKANEAINKEIIKALQPTDRSSDTGSIGSFLSMSSVKAFPKQMLPEPLNRVLDPVFVTYYDNVDSSVAKSYSQHQHKQHGSTVATIESFPEPKAPPHQEARPASQSDNPDPGVLGPVVWERHKKCLNEATDLDAVRNVRKEAIYYSPIHDPATVRNQYSDLIEGAIQMFSSQDDLPMPLPARDFSNNRRITQFANRGSSAGVASNGSKQMFTGTRPSTAQPQKTSKSNQSTLPPSPTSGAWGDSSSLHSSQSPLVRPLSAGPFHHPERHGAHFTKINMSSEKRLDISAAPIIEAIQTELRKLKEEKNTQQYPDV